MLMLHSYVVLSGKKVRRMLFAGKATFSQACLEFKSTLPAGIPRMSRLPLHALQGFVAAARIGNLSRAAESLNFTVSALSHQMRGLEARLGQQLLVRKSRGVGLTRSEEPTSELQSLMRISYAVFFLKKNNTTPHNESQYKHSQLK